MSSQPSHQVGFGGSHAIVIGASMAGLLAGRVLSDHFERVTIIERDRLPEGAQPRKGVPQGRHVHVLLGKGTSILAEFFPDLFPALVQRGSTSLDAIADVRWYHYGVWKARFPSHIISYSQSRPFLEQHVRDRLAARANVCFIEECEVIKLCASSDQTRITGVQLRHRNREQGEELLFADLIVDASGRGSQGPRWLASLGYPSVEEATVKVDVGYATRIYQQHSQASTDWKLLVVYPKPPTSKRFGVISPIEGDRWMVTLAGGLRDYPPDDESGFLEYARSLSERSLYETIKDAEPVTPIVTDRFPANRWRHYERLSHFPEGLVVLGDALCSLDPIYGQGMTVAALDARTLDACLHQQQHLRARGDITGLARRFQKAAAKVVAGPWLLATGEDFRYPEAQGQRPFGTRLLHWYTGRVLELTASNLRMTLRFYEVLHMLKPPAALFEPRIALTVLFDRRR